MMTRMSPSFPLFVMSCLFLTAESHQGSISPPQNLSLLWIAPFEAQFSWEPPPHSVENCTYTGIVKTNDHKGPIRSQNISSPWQLIISMEGGFLEFSLKIDCNGSHSPTAVKNFTYPDLVKNLTCYIYGAKKSHCSWHPASQAPDLRFFYGLVNETFGHTEKLPLKECSSFPDGVRNSCDLEADIYQSIFIFFNGTVNNKVARNTFKPSNHVQPPPLNWTVVKNGDKFHISWTPPDIGVWKFTIRYTECNEQKIRDVEEGNKFVLPLVPHCQYKINIMAKESKINGGSTLLTADKCFDADTDPKAWLYAAVIIPLMLACLVALLFVCCRKNKEYIFPKIPEPRDLLSDISENNNKSTVLNLYIPAQEEGNCKITLVVDPLINKLDF